MARVGDEAGDASNKRQRASGLEESPAQTTVMDTTSAFVESAFVEFTVNLHLAASRIVNSDAISTGGYMWMITYRHNLERGNLWIMLESKSSSANAIFEVMLIDKDGQRIFIDARRTTRAQTFSYTTVWFQSLSGDDLVKEYVKDGQIKFLCTIRVLHGDSITVPPSDIVRHLGMLLDTANGKDVSFTIDGEMFHAHRAVLAARSPVFKAELHGSMAEATMRSITLHDIAPATFKVMLRFMYTDTLPADEDLGEVMVEHLLAAADRYALDRLKLLCAQKLWDNVSADNVATTLAYAEMYSCPELKNKCIGFFAEGINFKKAMLTEGFAMLVHEFPSIIAELRDSVGI